jgi:hypothetical protein
VALHFRKTQPSTPEISTTYSHTHAATVEDQSN